MFIEGGSTVITIAEFQVRDIKAVLDERLGNGRIRYDG